MDWKALHGDKTLWFYLLSWDVVDYYLVKMSELQIREGRWWPEGYQTEESRTFDQIILLPGGLARMEKTTSRNPESIWQAEFRPNGQMVLSIGRKSQLVKYDLLTKEMKPLPWTQTSKFRITQNDQLVILTELYEKKEKKEQKKDDEDEDDDKDSNEDSDNDDEDDNDGQGSEKLEPFGNEDYLDFSFGDSKKITKYRVTVVDLVSEEIVSEWLFEQPGHLDDFVVNGSIFRMLIHGYRLWKIVETPLDSYQPTTTIDYPTNLSLINHSDKYAISAKDGKNGGKMIPGYLAHWAGQWIREELLTGHVREVSLHASVQACPTRLNVKIGSQLATYRCGFDFKLTESSHPRILAYGGYNYVYVH